MRARGARDGRLGQREGLAEAGVEADGEVAHQLQVLALVLAHRHAGRAVQEHVGGLQHRVVEEAHRDGLLPLGLGLELGHPAELAHRGDAVQHPGQLRVLGHVALDEEDAAVRVEAGRHEQAGRVDRELPQLGRVVGHGHRVQVDDAEDGLAAELLLVGHVVADRPEEVADVLLSGGLDAREDPRRHGGQPTRRLRAASRGPGAGRPPAGVCWALPDERNRPSAPGGRPGGVPGAVRPPADPGPARGGGPLRAPARGAGRGRPGRRRARALGPGRGQRAVRAARGPGRAQGPPPAGRGRGGGAGRRPAGGAGAPGRPPRGLRALLPGRRLAGGARRAGRRAALPPRARSRGRPRRRRSARRRPGSRARCRRCCAPRPSPRSPT